MSERMPSNDSQQGLSDPAIADRLTRYQQLQPRDRPAEREAMLDLYPQLKSELIACLEGLELLDGIVPILPETSTVEEPMSDQQEDLADFTILRELGRGGMGVVYEARQRSLGRRVALKVLPFASFLDQRRLQRFRQEAQAAAMLKQPNIVSVHCVGKERGVHFYAMELVEGVSFADVLAHARAIESKNEHGSAGTKQSANEVATSTVALANISTIRSTDKQDYFRRIATLGATIADALQYAHDEGVVHRDIKPSNLLLDDDGKPWIADFGLALIQHDNTMTMSGDVLGTLKYMSPEQAEGKKLLDGRTDVFSLGATLYELLTLKPAMPGDNKRFPLSAESAEIIDPRKIDAEIPVDLETILLRATESACENRYASAAALADDLRSFVNKRPIKARRPSLTRRSLLWIQRHPSLSLFVSVVCLGLLTLAVVGPILATKFRNLAQDANAANTALQDKNHALIRLMRESMNTTVQAIENLPESETINPELCEKLIQDYEKLLEQDPQNEELQFAAAQAYWQMSWGMAFRFDQAYASNVEWARKAEEIAEALVSQKPNNAEYRALLAWTKYILGFAYNLNTDARARSAVEHARHAVAMESKPIYRSDLAHALANLAKYLGAKREHDMARSVFQESKQLFETLIEEFPANSDYRTLLAWHEYQQAINEIWRKGDRALALKHLQRAESLYREDYSDTWCYARMQLGHVGVLQQLGIELSKRGRYEEAEKHLNHAVELINPLRASYKNSQWANQAFLGVYERFAAVLWARSRSEAIEAIEQGLVEVRSDRLIAENRSPRDNLIWRLAMLLWHANRKEESRTRLAQIGPDRCDGITRISFYLFHPIRSKRKPHRALDELGLIAKYVPALAEHLRATAELQLGNTKAAESRAERANQGSDYAISGFVLACVQYRRGETEEAIQTYQNACVHTSQNHLGDVRCFQFAEDLAEEFGIPNPLSELLPAEYDANSFSVNDGEER